LGINFTDTVRPLPDSSFSLELSGTFQGLDATGATIHVDLTSPAAFATLDDAKKFQAKFGGEIMSFNGARQKAQEDFKFKRKY